MGIFDRLLSFDPDRWDQLLERAEDRRLPLPDAEALNHEALDLCGRRGGQDFLVGTYVNHGQLLKGHRRLGKAIAMMDRAVTESSRLNGASSPETAMLRTHLADAYDEAGRTEHAIRVQREAHAV